MKSRLAGLVRRHVMLAVVIVAYAVTAWLRPALVLPAVSHATAYLGQIGVLLVGAYCFLGLFEEWISPAVLTRSIGRHASRARALCLATLAGACATGPVYVTYPLATLFAGAGASLATIVTFMSSWQIVKIAFLPFEIQCLGARFAVLRLLCATLVPVPSGLLTEALLHAMGVQTVTGRARISPPD